MNPSYLPVLKKICQDVRREMANKSMEDNDIEWDVNAEVLFFYAMMGHKPVGVNKHFMMLLIHNKFTSFMNHQLSSKVLWDHLDTMYDMPSLHDSEIIPFPNEEVDFELPEECHDLLFSKYGVSLNHFSGEKDSKSSMNLKSKKHGTPKFRQSGTPVTTSKSSFVTPTSAVNKVHKSHPIVKNESKTPATYGSLKFRQEFGVTVKATKLKHSPSLYGNKYSKFESSPVAKEESHDISSKKRMEKSCSSTIAKKPLKVESATASSISKKLMKTEGIGNGSKLAKADVSVSSQKKVKEYSSRKGKVTPPIDNAYCKKKAENVSVKKRNDSDNLPKKMHESTALKHTKSDVKTSSHSYKGQESETPPSVGSRKSSHVVKAKSESTKKPSRTKSDESVRKVAAIDSAKKATITDSAKKVAVTSKRRRQ